MASGGRSEVWEHFTKGPSGTKRWDGSPVQTRDKSPQPGQDSGSQQQFFRHSQKRKIKHKNKTRPCKNKAKTIISNSFK
ncbi:hypothetical protein PO909_000063 [Leuciscus waleckii]